MIRCGGVSWGGGCVGVGSFGGEVTEYRSFLVTDSKRFLKGLSLGECSVSSVSCRCNLCNDVCSTASFGGRCSACNDPCSSLDPCGPCASAPPAVCLEKRQINFLSGGGCLFNDVSPSDVGA